MVAEYRAALLDFLTTEVGSEIHSEAFGPKSAGFALARLTDYPFQAATTWVTIGLGEAESSMWKGLPQGRELVLSLATPDDDVVGMLRSALLEDRRQSRERLGFIRQHGVWAPGYPPHLVFLESPAVPGLMIRKRLGPRYVTFMAVAPIDDRELRLYDRDPGAFIRDLAQSADLLHYPRPVP